MVAVGMDAVRIIIRTRGMGPAGWLGSLVEKHLGRARRARKEGSPKRKVGMCSSSWR